MFCLKRRNSFCRGTYHVFWSFSKEIYSFFSRIKQMFKQNDCCNFFYILRATCVTRKNQKEAFQIITFVSLFFSSAFFKFCPCPNLTDETVKITGKWKCSRNTLGKSLQNFWSSTRSTLLKCEILPAELFITKHSLTKKFIEAKIIRTSTNAGRIFITPKIINAKTLEKIQKTNKSTSQNK